VPAQATVTALSVSAIKGLRVRTVERITLQRDGAQDDRRFFLVDEHGRMLNGKMIGALQEIVSTFDPQSGRLTLDLPGDIRVSRTVALGAEVTTRFFSSERTARLVDGPWSQAISAHVERPLRLVMAESAVDRGLGGAVSLVSSASLRHLAEVAETDAVDARRFRMLIEIDGVEPHAEDRWVGRRLRVGDAVLRFAGHVGRCLVTSRDPESGTIDLPTLDLLRTYRTDVVSTEPLPFGVYGAVEQPGAIRLHDPVELIDRHTPGSLAG
jgi:uncharacterized protein YcbX